MQISKLGKFLAVAIVLLLGVQSQCLAQSDGDRFFAPTSLTPTQTYGTGTPVATPAPMLQGASCGTIGPQGGDATSIIGVNTAGRVRAQESFPIVPTFLVSMLSLSMLFFGLRFLLVQRRAPLYVVGSIAAGALLLAGFIWAAISAPTFITFVFYGLSMLDQINIP